MFSKKEKPSTAAQTSSHQAKRPALDTVLGPGAELTGDIKVNAGARIDSKVKGNVVCQGDLTVGDKGVIEGEIKAKNLILAGTVKGKIVVEATAELGSSARLEGDIVCARLIVEEGAFFQGNCQMTSETKTPPASSTQSTP